jgi:hypothetical protein
MTRYGMQVIIDSESRAYDLKYESVTPLSGLTNYGGVKYPVLVIRVSTSIQVTLDSKGSNSFLHPRLQDDSGIPAFRVSPSHSNLGLLETQNLRFTPVTWSNGWLGKPRVSDDSVNQTIVVTVDTGITGNYFSQSTGLLRHPLVPTEYSTRVPVVFRAIPSAWISVRSCIRDFLVTSEYKRSEWLWQLGHPDESAKPDFMYSITPRSFVGSGYPYFPVNTTQIVIGDSNTPKFSVNLVPCRSTWQRHTGFPVDSASGSHSS